MTEEKDTLIRIAVLELGCGYSDSLQNVVDGLHLFRSRFDYLGRHFDDLEFVVGMHSCLIREMRITLSVVRSRVGF